MAQLAGLFVDNLVPILLIAAGGYAVGAIFQLESRGIALVTFNIFSPCLVYRVISQSQLGGGQVLGMTTVALVSILGTGLLALGLGRLLRLPRPLLSAFVLAATAPNSGNYGLSLTMLAFGSQALAHAGVYFVTASVLIYSVGVFVASMGSTDTLTALKGLLRVPAVYAALFAIASSRLGWELPKPIDHSLSMVADAAIPAFLVVLGLQMHRVQAVRLSAPLALAGALRLLASPALAFVAVLLLGLSGPARQAAIIEGAMPTAVAATILAEAYDAEPGFVTAAVFLSTLASPLTLTPLLAMLGAG